MARLGDWKAARLVCPPFKHDEVFGATFTPDGRWVLTSSRDRTLRIWEWRTGKAVSPPLPLRGHGWAGRTTPDGTHAVAAGQLGPAIDVHHLGDLSEPDALSLDDLCTLGEILSGHRIHDTDVTHLTTSEWVLRWRSLRKRHPAFGRYEP